LPVSHYENEVSGNKQIHVTMSINTPETSLRLPSYLNLNHNQKAQLNCQKLDRWPSSFGSRISQLSENAAVLA
jgi:hypothetical protein